MEANCSKTPCTGSSQPFSSFFVLPLAPLPSKVVALGCHCQSSCAGKKKGEFKAISFFLPLCKKRFSAMVAGITCSIGIYFVCRNCILPLFLEMKQCLPDEDPGRWAVSWERDWEPELKNVRMEWPQAQGWADSFRMDAVLFRCPWA